MRVLITGSEGFIGKNLVSRLTQYTSIKIVTFTRKHKAEELPGFLEGVDFVFHLAGTNRSENKENFLLGNSILTIKLCEAVRKIGKLIPIVYASSIQAEKLNDYGKSKKAAEHSLLALKDENKNPVFIFRLPNIFGKWGRPNYNSVVATFCYNLARNLPISINNRSEIIRLIYIDDVVDAFVELLNGKRPKSSYISITTDYELTVGQLAEYIKCFAKMQKNLLVGQVGSGFLRALYSTYLSYLAPDYFSYSLQSYDDQRGTFVEILKTTKSGQFSFFTARPGSTRGGHFHDTKNEKFLVVKGKAYFRFRNIVNGEHYQLYTSSDKPTVVQTIPGWAHDITNVGNDDLICLLWANEVFNPDKPDTFLYPLNPRS